MPITEGDVPELLRREEAAAFLGVSRATLDRMIARREIEFSRVGNGRGRVRITKRALLDHLNRNVVKADKSRTA